MRVYRENPEREGDWLRAGVTNFLYNGYVLYPEQKQIYHHLACCLRGKDIVEAGCGIGVGTGMLAMENCVVGTDRSHKQIRFARELYPLCEFSVWDITESAYPCSLKEVLVAVEVIEHVKDYQAALDNMLSSAKEAYISTPNRNNPKLGQCRPINDLHVREFTPVEFDVLSGGRLKRILDWSSFKEVGPDTEITPLVYHLW